MCESDEKIIILKICIFVSSVSFAENLVKDPLGSVQWDDMYAAF